MTLRPLGTPSLAASDGHRGRPFLYSIEFRNTHRPSARADLNPVAAQPPAGDDLEGSRRT